MYSNLRVGGGGTNHLLVSRTVPLTDIPDDVVRIVRSSDPHLAAYGHDGYGITWHQLRAYAVDHPGVALTYERHGGTHDLGRAGDEPAMVAPVSTLQRKLWVFRSVDLHWRERCLALWGVAR